MSKRKCKWNNYNLIERYDKIYDAIAKCEDPDLLQLYQHDLMRLDYYLEEERPQNVFNPKYIDIYKMDKKFINSIDFLTYDLLEFADITEDYEIITDIKNYSLSQNDLLDLTHDFYKNAMDKRIYGNFMKNFRKRFDHVNFDTLPEKSNYGGYAFGLASLNETFIDIKRENNLSDLIKLIHEYMHAINHTLSLNYLDPNKKCYSEVDTAFVELVALDYFKKYFPEDKINEIKISRHSTVCDLASFLGAQIKLVELEKKLGTYQSNKDLRRAIRYGNFNEVVIEDILNANDEEYVIGYMFALELFNIYKQDKNMALLKLRNFIQMYHEEEKDYYKALKNMGLMPNKHLREYHREVMNDMNRLTLKKKYKKRPF